MDRTQRKSRALHGYELYCHLHWCHFERRDLHQHFENMNHPEYVWYTLGGHLILGIIVIYLYTKTIGKFTEREE